MEKQIHTSISIPVFKYHPDPIVTGSLRLSKPMCRCCRQARGLIYVGPVYARADLQESLCPWCIADGSAHRLFAAEFTDFNGVGGYGSWDNIPILIKEEVAYRTPGFCGWQQEKWWTHCSDAAAFVGYAGCKEVESCGPDLVEMLRLDSGLTGQDEWQTYFRALDKVRGPTAYLFRCLHCGKTGGYSDCH